MATITKSEQEWQAQLTDEQYYVTRQKGTERPYTGELLNESRQGVFACVCCNTDLFYSSQKFESHCGWPAFDECKEGSVSYIEDHTNGMSRVEIVCSACEAHLGHVFNDGPTATGNRYCVNSASMTFREC